MNTAVMTDDDVRTPFMKLVDAVTQIRKLDNSAERRDQAVIDAEETVIALRGEMEALMDPSQLLDNDGVIAMQEKATELKRANELLVKRKEAIGTGSDDRLSLIDAIKELADEL